MQTLVDEARAHDRRVMCHALGGRGLDIAIEAGVNSIEHGCYLAEDPRHLEKMAERGIFFTPTLLVYEYHRRSPQPHVRERAEALQEAHVTAIRRALERGVRVVAGTDAGGHGHPELVLDPANDIVRHYDVTHKNCPAPWVTDSSKFNDFKNSVVAKLAPADSADGKLTRGERGPNVKQLNLWLKELEYTTKDDDFYDQYTDAALRAFLKDQGLPEDTVYTSAIGDLLVKAIERKEFIADAKNAVVIDLVPAKNPDKFRLAKFCDTDDLNVIEQYRKDGYKVIELPTEAK
jgi:hypothetical protein